MPLWLVICFSVVGLVALVITIVLASEGQIGEGAIGLVFAVIAIVLIVFLVLSSSGDSSDKSSDQGEQAASSEQEDDSSTGIFDIIIGGLALIELIGGVKTIIEGLSSEYPQEMAAGALIVLMSFIAGGAPIPQWLSFVFSIIGLLPAYNKEMRRAALEAVS